jgi:signal transduction histidine kinase
LKNPLSAIQGLSDMLRSEYKTMPSEEVIEVAENIFKASRQMFELITTLLDVNVIESGKLNVSIRAVDILPILQALVINYTQRAQTKNLTLHFQSAETSILPGWTKTPVTKFWTI